jgi:signal transduction histidine kinase
MQFAKPDAPKPARQRLADLLEPRCQHWRTRSTLTEQQLQLRLGDADVTFYADADHVRTILDEVVANAIEACSKDSIHLQVNSPSAASDETVRIVVEDNGVGMPRECLEHAVDPFYSNRPAGRRRGLGLSRAYRLAEINGGRLWLDSTPDIGTTVTLELPARAPEI